jgi:hypothetical protein
MRDGVSVQEEDGRASRGLLTLSRWMLVGSKLSKVKEHPPITHN